MPIMNSQGTRAPASRLHGRTYQKLNSEHEEKTRSSKVDQPATSRLSSLREAGDWPKI